MQDKNNVSSTNPDSAAVAAASAAGKATQSDFVRKIVDKIKTSENILIALSKDPSVDEIAASIGLALYLDGMGKHATAIYSGRTPDELSFLQPDDTFEKNTDSLQDFIIALNKEKADHLRYKLEGEFVKVFITPYKVRLTEDDLNFSYGDYNVDFVIAINVPSAADLDSALHEHGRIMHDASAVNITTGDAGKFGEIEWSNPVASSLCEMVTELVFALQGDDETPLDNDVATALLTGIVAATDRFSNNRTNSDTLSLASKLMSMGANQQLISSNVRGNDIVHNDETSHDPEPTTPKRDETKLEVDHDEIADVMSGRGVNNSGTPSTTNNPGTMVNPAAQMAPALNNTMADPATMVNGTNNVTPEDVVVQPIIPGAASNAPGPAVPTAAPTGIPAGDTLQIPVPTPADPVATMAIPTSANPVPAAAAPMPETANPNPAPVTLNPASEAANPAPEAPSGRSMAESEPATPTTRQFGTAIQPPAPNAKAEKNYAEMMAAALAEQPTNQPGVVATPAPAVPSVATASQPANQPGAIATPEPAPAQSDVAQATPIMEPVANPNEILPPPPAPAVGTDGMPPVLPNVQITPPANGAM